MTVSSTHSFDRYDRDGAYHWFECDRRSRVYNAPLVARYQCVKKRVPAGKKILDIGCGDGYLMHLLSPEAHSVTGIDPERTAVQLARKMLSGNQNCTVTHGDAYEIPFEDQSFDVVVMADVIEHLEDDKRSCREAARVVVPDGLVLMSTPKRRTNRAIRPEHVREYEANELRHLCETHFRDVTITCTWPDVWLRLYHTRIGWRVIRELARRVYNPFLREGANPRRFAQLVAMNRGPRLR